MPAPIELQNFAPNARSFLEDLAENNDRDWFRRQKGRYDAEVKRPAERLMDQLAPRLAAEVGSPVRTKLFRPHRDVRFSEDKTPYHTHLHAAWSVPDGRGWYFGLSPDYATAGGGVMAFDPEQLGAWRDAVSGPPGDELASILQDLGARIDPPELPEVPDPHDDGHPHEALLRRKGCVVWLDDLYESLTEDPLAGLEDAFLRLQPLQDWLARYV